MIKQLKTAFFCITTLLATPLLASTLYTFQTSPAVDYELPSNEPQVFSNVFRWAIHAECVAIQDSDETTILFKMLRKKGVLNDISLSRGESIRINVQRDEKFTIVAEPGATVQMTNEGDELLIARCTAATT